MIAPKPVGRIISAVTAPLRHIDIRGPQILGDVGDLVGSLVGERCVCGHPHLHDQPCQHCGCTIYEFDNGRDGPSSAPATWTWGNDYHWKKGTPFYVR